VRNSFCRETGIRQIANTNPNDFRFGFGFVIRLGQVHNSHSHSLAPASPADVFGLKRDTYLILFRAQDFFGRSDAPSPRHQQKSHVAPDSDSDSDSDSLLRGRGFSDSGSGSFRGGWVIWIRIRVRFRNQTKFRRLSHARTGVIGILRCSRLGGHTGGN